MLRKKRGGKEDKTRIGDAEGCSVGGEELMRMSVLASLSNDSSISGNVDSKLLDDLQDLLPLLESFLDREPKASRGFTRKGKIVYTKTPTKDSVLKKANDQKGRRISESLQTGERSILGKSDREDCDAASAQQVIEAEKVQEEIGALTYQLEYLRQTLLEKEELVSAAEIRKSQLASLQEELKEVQYQLQEKNSSVLGFETQVSDAKRKLAERRAVLEMIQREAITSNNQVEKLQKDMKNAELEMSAFNILIEALKDDTDVYANNYDRIPNQDDMDELDLKKMEEARNAYVDAVAAAKENQDDESLVAAGSARLYLQSFVMSA